MTEFNIEDYLNSLPDDIETIDVSYKDLTYLPSLKRFYKLKNLACNYNKLTALPELPPSLKILYCFNNQLTVLPELNPSLQILHCSNNQLTELPELNPSLQYLSCSNNQLPQKFNNNLALTSERKNKLNYMIQSLKRIKFNIMCLKYKKQFRDWLWIKVRQPMIEKQYHYGNLIELLEKIDEDDEETFDIVLESW